MLGKKTIASILALAMLFCQGAAAYAIAPAPNVADSAVILGNFKIASDSNSYITHIATSSDSTTYTVCNLMGYTTVEKVMLDNGDTSLTYIEGDKTDHVTIKANGDMYHEGKPIMVTTTNEATGKSVTNVLNAYQDDSTEMVTRGQRMEWHTDYVPKGYSPSDFTVAIGDPVTKNIALERQAKDATVGYMIDILTLGLDEVSGFIYSTMLTWYLNSLIKDHPYATAVSIWYQMYHHPNGFTVEPGLAAHRYHVKWYGGDNLTNYMMTTNEMQVFTYT